MMKSDRMMIWGAALVMAATAGFSLWRISNRPVIDPHIAQLTRELDSIAHSQVVRFPAPTFVAPKNPWKDPVTESRPGPGWAAYVRPRAVPGGDPPVWTAVVYVLPQPVIERVTSDLEGCTVRWSIAERKVDLVSGMTRMPARAEGFVVRRQRGAGPAQIVATLGPESRTYVDPSTEPLETYKYSVELLGKESDLRQDPYPLGAAVIRAAQALETRTPSATRVRLIGGDLSAALLRAEKYDRSQSKWIGQNLLVPAGHGIGASGWTLKRLKFDRFTLTADVQDDSGTDHVLTTKD